MKVQKFKHLILLVAYLTISQNSAAQVDDAHARSIVQASETAAYYAGNDGRSLARMIIMDGKGQKQVRQFTILRQDIDDRGDQNLMVFFSRPSDVRDTVFRVVKHTDQDDDRWLYLPGLDLVKRISAGDKRTSFVGSHFFYEDVSGRNTEEDYFELISENDQYFEIKAVPKNPASVEFTRYTVHIEKSTMLPRKIEFYDAKDRMYRRVESLKVETVNGHPTVLHSRVEDLLNGGATEMQFRFVEYDLGLPENLFSERSLRTPPRRWLRVKG